MKSYFLFTVRLPIGQRGRSIKIMCSPCKQSRALVCFPPTSTSYNITQLLEMVPISRPLIFGFWCTMSRAIFGTTAYAVYQIPTIYHCSLIAFSLTSIPMNLSLIRTIHRTV
ncbi:hypothetical protein PENTCL1PPCAC_15585 [Pristionchus entomophagus]|uniref:G protein-coupled receptor n=1 Tax=Pristionchus entomophagus TaxID=358040 RepID=A0AAV5TCW7_9BILA|nr:hypothetical protein PENTCL1PPCAC_15585 [Pristionchus entomophagus]